MKNNFTRRPYWALVSLALATPAVQADITIAPLGTPRILVSNAATLTHLRQLLADHAPSAMRYKAMVDNQIAGVADYYGFEPWYAALMGQVTGNARYCSYAVQKTDAFVRSEERLIGNNKRPTVAGDSYLEVGPIIGNMALVYDWCRDSIPETRRQQWKKYGNRAVWNVWHPTKAQWGNNRFPWSGWSVNNPVNNYYYSFLEATAFLGLATYGENTSAPTWITQFRTTKLDKQLFPTFNRDLVGGGSREGTGYGTAMKNLWRLYDWWERSTGERIADLTPHTRLSMAHLMHNITPTLDQLAPTGDHARDSTASLFDYHRDYLQTLMALYPADPLAGVAKSLLAQSSVPKMQNSFMFYSDYLYDHGNITAQPLSNLATAYWGSGTGMWAMRSSWDKNATYANVICGPYTESHAHPDQGSFTLFGGSWLAYDANIDSHSGLQQVEAAHNLVRIEQDGEVIHQYQGGSGAGPCQMQALAHTDTYDYTAANVTPVYRDQPQVGKVEREMVFIKPRTLIVFDRVQAFGANTRKVWTLNTPVQPLVDGSNFHINRGSGANSHTLNVTRLAPAGLVTQVLAWPSLDEDVLAGYRVDVADDGAAESQFLNVLSVDGAVTDAMRDDAAGQLGTAVQLADGRKVTVRFNQATSGGTIEIRATDGTVLKNELLPDTVTTPALFVE